MMFIHLFFKILDETLSAITNVFHEFPSKIQEVTPPQKKQQLFGH